MIILYLNLVSCSFFKTKDEGLKSELCRSYRVKNDSLLIYKNYYHENIPIMEMGNEKNISNHIPFGYIIFAAGRIGNIFPLRYKIADKLFNQLKNQKLVSDNDTITIDNLLSLRKFHTYLIYASDESNIFLENKRLYIINYKNKKLLSWVKISELKYTGDIDEVDFGDALGKFYIVDPDTYFTYSTSSIKDIGIKNIVWTIQKDRYSSCNHKLFKKEEYAHFKINDSGYVEILK